MLGVHLSSDIMRDASLTLEIHTSYLPIHLARWSSRADQGRLLDYVVSWGNLTEEKVACYLRDVLEALHYLHNSRIVHLDVKVSPPSGCRQDCKINSMSLKYIRE